MSAINLGTAINAAGYALVSASHPRDGEDFCHVVVGDDVRDISAIGRTMDETLALALRQIRDLSVRVRGCSITVR